jgi:O-antigen/teichoic acid export membrane protein
VAGATVGGYYALIQRVVFNPVIIVTGILSQSILPWLSRTRDQGSAVLLAKFSSLAGITMLGMVIAVYFLAEPLFSVIFGEQWRQAGVYAGLLFLLLPYRVLYDLLSILLISENRQGTLFLTRGLALLLGVAVLFVFSEGATRELFLWFSFVQAVCALTGIFAVASVLQIPLSRLLRTMSIGLITSYLVVAFQGEISTFFGGYILNLLFALAGILIMATSLVAMKAVRDDGKV